MCPSLNPSRDSASASRDPLGPSSEAPKVKAGPFGETLGERLNNLRVNYTLGYTKQPLLDGGSSVVTCGWKLLCIKSTRRS